MKVTGRILWRDAGVQETSRQCAAAGGRELCKKVKKSLAAR